MPVTLILLVVLDSYLYNLPHVLGCLKEQSLKDVLISLTMIMDFHILLFCSFLLCVF